MENYNYFISINKEQLIELLTSETISPDSFYQERTYGKKYISGNSDFITLSKKKETMILQFYYLQN